ncbi:MAG: DUF3014 domain-containing protein [Pseudomonadales bacterium]
MHADEQDRISSTGSSIPGAGSGRSIVLDVIVVICVLLVAGFFAYRYFANLEPDYSTQSPSRYDDVSYNGYADDAQNSDTEELLRPQPLSEDQGEELQKKYDLPKETPQLNESDDDLLTQLQLLSSLKGIVAWSDAADLARRFVVLVYNLAEGQVAHKSLPLNSPQQSFSALGSGASLRVDPKSYQRYDVYADAFAAMDSERAIAIYRFFWPTLEAAFAELGEPRKSLHNESIKAIDHLLTAPDQVGDIKLVQPSVYYRYADPKLERLTPAQKQMLRLGPRNRALIKAKLAELKSLLVLGQN